MPTNSESNRLPRPCVSFRTETSRQPERWLLTGASGQLGRHLLAQFLVDLSSPVDFLPIARKGGCLNGHTVHSLDLRDRTALHRLLKEYRPTHIIHLASLSRPGLAQDNPQGFHDLDVTTTKHLAAYTVDVGGWMFYASSDFVLRGDCVGLQDENAAVRTNTIYARGKLEGEQAVLDCGAGCVGRLSMLWGMTADETPWGRLVARLIAGQEIFGITDELRTPLMFETAARIILALAVIPSTRHSGHRGYRGRINIGGDLVRTPFNLICHLRDNVAPGGVVLPITRSEYAPAMPRPANAALDISLLNRALRLRRPIFRGASLKLGVVIPVWHGEALLPRSLEGLLGQRSLPGPVIVAVVVNDADPRAHAAARQMAEFYADRMAARGYTYHVLSSPSGRRAAFLAGEKVLSAGACLYLDQDARLSSGALEHLARLICDTEQPCFATVSLRFSRSPSAFVRLVLQTLTALPYASASPVTAGCYAVSAAGRTLWDWEKMPAEVGDDKYVRRLFMPAARHLVKEEFYEVVAPNSYRALIAARTRYARMNRSLEALSGLGHDADRGEGVLRHLLWPFHWPGAILTALTLILASLLSRSRLG